MKVKTKTCRYCKRKFVNKRVSRPRVTCGRPACLKARRKELHSKYMKKPGPRAKNLAFQIEYKQRPEVKKRLKKYFKERIERIKKEAGIKPLRPRICPFCLKKYRPRSKREMVTCGRLLCKKKVRIQYSQKYHS